MLTDWDKQIIADLQKHIACIECAIEGKTDREMVRLPRGDARPESVAEHKQSIKRLLEEIKSIEAEFGSEFENNDPI